MQSHSVRNCTFSARNSLFLNSVVHRTISNMLNSKRSCCCAFVRWEASRHAAAKPSSMPSFSLPSLMYSLCILSKLPCCEGTSSGTVFPARNFGFEVFVNRARNFALASPLSARRLARQQHSCCYCRCRCCYCWWLFNYVILNLHNWARWRGTALKSAGRTPRVRDRYVRRTCSCPKERKASSVWDAKEETVNSDAFLSRTASRYCLSDGSPNEREIKRDASINIFFCHFITD